ncbi:sentrin-specific protease 8 [Bradysia coprophila]|uniref:sentrin-specific protease 8 n=1 Tax=Bradysia coprophila TaxID=38358 RepID=UPI00187DC991|nr:sentrin-specific protease 8 [Bradysia coprophila]
MSRHNDPTVLSFHESLLRQSDVALLQGPFWLNDHIISFYLEYLDMVVFEDNTDLLFISPEVTQCLKIVSENEITVFLEPLDAVNKSFIFFPLNDNDQDKVGGSHWSLLVYSKPEQAFYHFDSMSPSNEVHCEKFIRKIKNYLNVDAVVLRAAHCLAQTNGYDCGVHVLCNAENIAHHVVSKGSVDGVSKVTNDSVKRMRADIIDIINKLQTEK